MPLVCSCGLLVFNQGYGADEDKDGTTEPVRGKGVPVDLVGSPVVPFEMGYGGLLAVVAFG